MDLKGISKVPFWNGITHMRVLLSFALVVAQKIAPNQTQPLPMDLDERRFVRVSRLTSLELRLSH